MADFGEMLRECRQRCKDPENPRRTLSQGRLGELLGRELNIAKGYTAAAISDWERRGSKIHADDPFLSMCLIKGCINRAENPITHLSKSVQGLRLTILNFSQKALLL